MNSGLAPAAARIAEPDWKNVCSVAAEHAADVDREGRFPIEAVKALKASGALGLPISPELGGAGTGMATLARMARDLGAACASTACFHFGCSDFPRQWR